MPFSKPRFQDESRIGGPGEKLAAYISARRRLEDGRLLALYESRLEDVCGRTKVGKELMHRAVLRAYQRWEWADDPKFPNPLKKLRLD